MIIVIQTLLFGQDYNTTIGIKLNPGVATIYNTIGKNVDYARFSTSGGFELRQRIIKDMFYLETGVYFFDRGYRNKANYTDDLGNLGGKAGQEIEYYLNVPISLTFNYKGLYIGAGPNINYYLARRFIYDGELISTDKSYQSEDIIFGGQLFVGYEFNLSDKLLLAFDGFVNPTFKVNFLNCGLGIGLKYVLTKSEKEKTATNKT